MRDEMISPRIAIVQPEHEGSAARRADDTLNIGTVEAHPFRSEPVDVWCDRRLVAIAADPGGKIIGDDKEDVGTIGTCFRVLQQC